MTFMLLAIILMNALFESVLELQAGVVFVVFWVTFGLLLEPDQEDLKNGLPA